MKGAARRVAAARQGSRETRRGEARCLQAYEPERLRPAVRVQETAFAKPQSTRRNDMRREACCVAAERRRMFFSARAVAETPHVAPQRAVSKGEHEGRRRRGQREGRHRAAAEEIQA